MKALLITVFMICIFEAHANIEFDGKMEIPTEAELAKNRGCFEELAKSGCGDPGDDMKQFRICLHDAYPTLSDDCRQMMTRLYKKKNDS